MVNLQWNEEQKHQSAHKGGESSVSNPWFAVSVGLIGAIVGYLLAVGSL